MNKLLTLLAVTGAAIVLTIDAEPAALAGPDSIAIVCSPSACPAGTVTYLGNGSFRLCDDADDGYAVAMESYGPSGDMRIWDTHGRGTCINIYSSVPAGYTITFRACLGIASTDTIVACGPWEYSS